MKISQYLLDSIKSKVDSSAVVKTLSNDHFVIQTAFPEGKNDYHMGFTLNVITHKEVIHFTVTSKDLNGEMDNQDLGSFDNLMTTDQLDGIVVNLQDCVESHLFKGKI